MNKEVTNDSINHEDILRYTELPQTIQNKLLNLINQENTTIDDNFCNICGNKLDWGICRGCEVDYTV